MTDAKLIKTSCGICGSCCQIDAWVKDGKLVSVEGARNTPMQSGGMCAKGAAAIQFEYNKDRILYPMRQVGRKGEGKFERISWDDAYDMVAENLLKIKEKYGPQAAVFYAGYPKWYRPALLRLANAFGSPNYCTESSTCFQAAALAWRSLYGNRICPPDMKNTHTLLIWSSNLYHSNASMSRMYQNLKKRGVKIIDVDPRNSVTAHDADIHLQLVPGTDGALALSMAYVIIKEGLQDQEFIDKYVYGYEEYREYVQKFPPEKAAGITGVPADLIYLAARTYASNGPAAIMFSASPIVHHVNGVQNYRAVFALCAITGNYDVEGGNRSQPGPFSPANEFGKVKRFNGIEAIGEKDFPVWFDLSCDEAQCTRLADYINDEKPYPVKALFGMGFNHRMWPEPENLLQAVKKLDFFVNADFFFSASCKYADLILPSATTYEREEIYTVNGGCFYFSNRAIEPVGEAKNDIEIIIGVLKRMGLEDPVLANGYDAYMQYILEPSGLTLEELKASPCGMPGKNRFMPKTKTYEQEPFNTPSGKIELKSLVFEKYRDSYGYDALPVYHDFREITGVDRTEYPLILSTGCRKPHLFHARVYRVPWLANLEKATLVELNPEDGEKYGIKDGDSVKVISPAGEIEGIAAWNISGKAGVVFIYHGNDKNDANELISKDYLDPISGFPGFKSYFCRVEKVGGAV